jgi:hypothetical protein
MCWDVICNLLKQSRIFGIAMIATLLLSGCVQYDIGINFDNPNQGEILQHIRLSNLNSASTQQWLKTLENKARQLQGSTQSLNNQDLTLRIPFTNALDLESKFNEFLQVSTQQIDASDDSLATNLSGLASHFKMTQHNFIVLVQNHLNYDLNLQPLALLPTQNQGLLSSNTFIQLEFSLSTPWGAHGTNALSNGDVLSPLEQGRTLIWELRPGQLNHLEADFWLPSPLGIGTLLILLLVAGGSYFRRAVPPAAQD